LVNGPPEFTLPLAWQLLLIPQTVFKIGVISVENFGAMPVHENVTLVPLPLPPAEVLLLLQAVNVAILIIISAERIVAFFIIEF
jgi:hypothetical protein